MPGTLEKVVKLLVPVSLKMKPVEPGVRPVKLTVPPLGFVTVTAALAAYPNRTPKWTWTGRNRRWLF